MRNPSLRLAATALLTATVALLPETAVGFATGARSTGELPPYLQCVPYARQVTGIQIFGDAHTWWGQAKGRYARGSTPKVGAVMTLKPYRNMHLGHVAAVSKVVDSRTILLRHSNWSPINGRRGQIEDDVKAIDVSEDNDWSAVRVWYAPLQSLGGTHWPVQGFIYGKKTAHDESARSPAKLGKTKIDKRIDPIGAIIASKANKH